MVNTQPGRRVFVSSDGVLFHLVHLTKTQKMGSPPKERFFSASSDKCLCVVDCLRRYEEVTQNHRNPDTESQPLFLSYVTSQRIAYWIKDILCEAGVDTKVFKAHLVRGASESAAMSKGIDVYLTISVWQIGAMIPPSDDFTIAQQPSMYMLKGFSRAWMASEQSTHVKCISRGQRGT